MKTLVLLMLAIGTVGCTAPTQQVISARKPFPEAEYLALQKVGTATVKGQAFLKTRGGEVKTAAGNEVFLNPVTSYSLDWYENSYIPNWKMEPADPRQASYMKTKLADGNGHFVFKNVPAGEYFLTTSVFWESATGYQSSLRRQGGIISKKIKVIEGEELELVITK
jgi:hypothetical protein